MSALEERHGTVLQKKFSGAVVAVCGLGGLGSHIAVSLARAGIGRILLIDFDRVELTNLHRQQYCPSQIGMYKTEAMAENLREICPYLSMTIVNEKLREENLERILSDADVICEAFDCAESKAMLVNTVLEKMPEKYLVAASGMAGLGDPNEICTRRITGHFYLCGDGVSDTAQGMGLIAPRVMLCAAHQAQTVLRLLANEYEIK